MTKKSLFDQPGVEQLVPGQALPVGVKVTGRNMHAVTLLASVSGEKAGLRTVVQSFFESDGSLQFVVMESADGGLRLDAGEYLVLNEDGISLVGFSAEDYALMKAGMPLAVALRESVRGFAKALGLDLDGDE